MTFNVVLDRDSFKAARLDLYDQRARQLKADLWAQDALARRDEILSQAFQAGPQPPSMPAAFEQDAAAGTLEAPPVPATASTPTPPVASPAASPLTSAPSAAVMPRSPADVAGTMDLASRPSGRYSPFDDTFRRYAGPLSNDDEFLRIVAAGTLAESGWDTTNRTGDAGKSWGLFQMHEAGAGAGMGAARLDPEAASAVMVPKYARAYMQIRQQYPQLSGPELASLVAATAELPFDWQNPQGEARRNYAKAYQQIMGGSGQPVAPRSPVQALGGPPAPPIFPTPGSGPAQADATQGAPDATRQAMADRWAADVTRSIDSWLADREMRGLGEPTDQELSEFLAQEQLRKANAVERPEGPLTPTMPRLAPGSFGGPPSYMSAEDQTRANVMATQPEQPWHERLMEPRLTGVGDAIRPFLNPSDEEVLASLSPEQVERARHSVREINRVIRNGAEPTDHDIAEHVRTLNMAMGASGGLSVAKGAAARLAGKAAQPIRTAAEAAMNEATMGAEAATRGLSQPTAPQTANTLIDGLLQMARDRGVPEDRIAAMLKQQGYSELPPGRTVQAPGLMRKLSSEETAATFGKAPAQATTTLATTLGGAAAGATAGVLTADDSATPEERIIRGVLGAVAGAGAGAAIPNLAHIRNAVQPSQRAVRAMQRIQQQAPPARPAEVILNITRANLLSPVMMGMQLAGGTIETARRPVGTFLGGLVRADPTSMRAALDDVAAMGRAIPLGLANARDALLTGYRGSRAMFGEPMHPEVVNVAQGAKGIAITPAYRFFAAADELVRTANAHGAMAMAARAESRATGQPFQHIVQNAQMYPWVWNTAQEASARAIYEQGGTGLGRLIAETKRNWVQSGDPGRIAGAVVLDVLQPFSMIPDVLTAEGAKIIGHTATLGMAGVGRGVAISRGMTRGSQHLAQAERNLEAARAAGGALLAPIVATWMASQALGGNLTGQGAKSWSTQYRRELEQARDDKGQPLWRPNSVRVGDRWMNYEQVLGPWAPVASMTATAIEEWKDTGTLDGNTAEAAVNGAWSAWTKQVYLEDLFNFINKVVNRDLTGALEQKAGQQSGRIPYGGLMSTAVRATDEQKAYDKGFEGIGQRFVARVPGASQNVPDRQDVLGKPLKDPQDAVSLLAPGRPTTPQPQAAGDRVMRLFVDARMAIPDADDRISVPNGRTPLSIPINEEEKRIWREEFGRIVEAIGSSLEAIPAFKSAPLEERQKMLRDKVLAEARKYADLMVAQRIGGGEIGRRVVQDRQAPQRQPFRP